MSTTILPSIELPPRKQQPVPQYYDIGLLGPLLFGPLWVMLMSQWFPHSVVAYVSSFVLIALLVVCSYTDVLWLRIPNWATYSATLWAWTLSWVGSIKLEMPQMIWHCGFCGPRDWAIPLNSCASPLSFSGLEWGTMGWAPPVTSCLSPLSFSESWWGAVACLGAMLVVYSVAGSGGGDVKLGCAIGALLGVQQGLNVLVWAHLLAGLVLLPWIVWKIGPLRCVTNFARRIAHLAFPLWVFPPAGVDWPQWKKPIPLAPFFAAGVVLVLTGVTLL